MEQEHPQLSNRSKKLPLFLFAVFLLGISSFFLTDQFQPSFAAISALIAIPASFGGLLAYAFDFKDNKSALGCFVWPTLGLIAMVGFAWLALGEGVICIAMVLPLWIPAAIGGYAVSLWNIKYQREKMDQDGARMLSVSWLLCPLLIVTIETYHPPVWQDVVVTRDIDINASVETVWPLLISIPKILPSEGNANFSQDILGVPRPRDAILVRESGVLIRKARWGRDIRFDERIDQIDPLKSIAWSFAFPDQSIQKQLDHHISPNGDLLKIKFGRYDLISISPSVTRVRLTTRYSMRTQLTGYLMWWGERLLGDIQTNVLTIVRERAQATARYQLQRESGRR
jgi:hypothetical protein